MTTVPPANSTPRGMPLVTITAMPAMMTIHETTMAWIRHRRKSYLVSLKMCIKAICCQLRRSDTQRRDLLPVRQRHLEQRLRHEDRREQVRQQADEQRHRETADRAGAELEQKRARDAGRDVCVDQRPEDAVEARVDRRADAALRLQLLFDALEDQHVRVDA